MWGICKFFWRNVANSLKNIANFNTYFSAKTPMFVGLEAFFLVRRYYVKNKEMLGKIRNKNEKKHKILVSGLGETREVCRCDVQVILVNEHNHYNPQFRLILKFRKKRTFFESVKFCLELTRKTKYKVFAFFPIFPI